MLLINLRFYFFINNASLTNSSCQLLVLSIILVFAKVDLYLVSLDYNFYNVQKHSRYIYVILIFFKRDRRHSNIIVYFINAWWFYTIMSQRTSKFIYNISSIQTFRNCVIFNDQVVCSKIYRYNNFNFLYLLTHLTLFFMISLGISHQSHIFLWIWF